MSLFIRLFIDYYLGSRFFTKIDEQRTLELKKKKKTVLIGILKDYNV